MTYLYHIAPRTDWLAAQQARVYMAASLHSEGFIHCSLAHQVERVANAFYTAVPDLVLLVIAEGRVTPEVRYEDVPDSDQKFPHIYGPLNVDAIVQVVPFPIGDDGTYRLPPGVPHDG